LQLVLLVVNLETGPVLYMGIVLDSKTRQRIARIARRRRISISAAIREAIESWIERQESIASSYEAMADLIGVVHGGKPGRSAKSGRQLKEILKSSSAKSRIEDDELRITRLKCRIERGQGLVRRNVKPGTSLVDELIAERREAARTE
jgi:predicted DNA-binding protein